MNMKTRLFCLLLALVLLISAFPLYALADSTETTAATEAEEPKPETGTVTVKVVVGKKTLYTYTVTVGDSDVTLSDSKYIKHNKLYYEYSYYTVSGKKATQVTIPAYDVANPDTWKKNWADTIQVVYVSHSHSYRFSYGRLYHWNICRCGHTTNEVPHVDPATDSDKICTCGYKFSSNTDLSTLWLSHVVLSPRFKKGVTEFTGEVHTYRDITSTNIVATPFDALATVELPENLEIHEGANKFEITVTAEDKEAKQTYTVIAVKPVKVDNTLISTDGTTVSAPLKTKVKKSEASASPSEAVTDKMLELAAADKASAISFQTKFSKWSTKHADVTVSAEFLKSIAETTEASLVLPMSYGTTLTVPHAEIAALAEGHETVTFRVLKDNTFAILADGEELTAPDTITLTMPEA